ncbi:putative E3 ubiquitin-protein ligase RING1a, partial [Ophiophagus hannah]
EAHGTRHEVDGDHEAEGKDGVFGLALVLLEDVDAGKSKEDDPDDPEETPAQDVQEIEEESKEKRHEPISQQDGANQQKGPGGIIGEGGVAEIMGQVGSWKKRNQRTRHQRSLRR